jgi:hypothetical protein
MNMVASAYPNPTRLFMRQPLASDGEQYAADISISVLLAR